MNPAEAAYFGVKQGDLMKLRVGGAAALTFNNVHVRIDPTRGSTCTWTPTRPTRADCT